MCPVPARRPRGRSARGWSERPARPFPADPARPFPAAPFFAPFFARPSAANPDPGRPASASPANVFDARVTEARNTEARSPAARAAICAPTAGLAPTPELAPTAERAPTAGLAPTAELAPTPDRAPTPERAPTAERALTDAPVVSAACPKAPPPLRRAPFPGADHCASVRMPAYAARRAAMSDPADTVPDMAKSSPGALFQCSECGWQTTKWAGRCGECQTWGSITQGQAQASAGRSGRALLRGLPAVRPGAPAVPISKIDASGAAAKPTGMDELDRVLGGGLVPGTVALLAGVPGGVTQVREITSALVSLAKQRTLTTVLVGHVTKDGSIAGPRSLEHLVDVVLHFEGDSRGRLRMIRALKNRFGPTDEIGCFELGEFGLIG